MSAWPPLLRIACGSAIGALARWLLALAVVAVVAGGGSVVLATLAANLLGSLLIGWLAARAGSLSEPARQWLMAGFCAGFTTFSLFSLETFGVFERHGAPAATGLAALSVTAWLLGAAAGFAAGRRGTGR